MHGGYASSITHIITSGASFASRQVQTKVHSAWTTPIHAAFGRFDYNPRRKAISFRMPSTLRDLFISINNALSSRIVLIDGEDKWEQQPDAHFAHEKVRHPGVVLEAGLAQDPNELRRIAKLYSHYSDGQRLSSRHPVFVRMIGTTFSGVQSHMPNSVVVIDGVSIASISKLANGQTRRWFYGTVSRTMLVLASALK
ncbi:Fatty acid transporter protein [Fusarium oxysporum f. sp. albedinis]|nr:Fatty acid transporter protein [Fusarium oxysporum f. sp. albedinis]